MTDFERIENLITHFRLKSMNAFAKKTGVHIDTIRNIRDGKVKITVETANRIVNTYDNVRYEWVLNGEGEMINPEDKLTESPPGHVDEQIKYLTELLRSKDKIIQMLEEKIEDYKKNADNAGEKRKAAS